MKKGKLVQTALFGDWEEGQKSYLKTVLKAKKRRQASWRGNDLVPPGSLLEIVLKEFENNTNIPLEVPFITLFHYISAYLISSDVTIEFNNKHIKADFWSIVLAESGAGKTWTQKTIRDAFADNIPLLQGGVVSAAAFVDSLEDKPKSLWVRDEFLQVLKQIETPGPMCELKDYLLRIYDNEQIQRKTKKGIQTIEDPVLSILGFNVSKSFCSGMSAESLTDGFAQRFAYVLAKKDPKRHFSKYPIWSVNNEFWLQVWNQTIEGIHKSYKANKDAETEFKKSFELLIAKTDDIDESFYRRVLWRAHKYALIYHILRGQAKNNIVDKESYAWAVRLIQMQLGDAGEVIAESGGSELGKLIDKAEKIKLKLEAQGVAVTPRLLLQRCKEIGTAQTARFIFGILNI